VEIMDLDEVNVKLNLVNIKKTIDFMSSLFCIGGPVYIR
jgi:hypothetical protein